MNHKKWIWILGLTIIGAILYLLGIYSPLMISEVSLVTEKIGDSIKIALISDLHSCKYGREQDELIEAISKKEPDIVCLTGDIFDDNVPDEQAELFLQKIAGKYSCYYVTGNHEYWSGEKNFQKKMKILDKYGIKRLSNEVIKLECKGQKINLCGVEDPDAFLYEESFTFWDALQELKKKVDTNAYTVLLSHRPEQYKAYVANGFDLALCGHAHGGQWRIPGILDNGVYAPNQGFFPSYTSGKFRKKDTTMIVSRGLARESTPVPRIMNRPEIVLITIIPSKK